jgi:hypothetical protein
MKYTKKKVHLYTASLAVSHTIRQQGNCLRPRHEIINNDARYSVRSSVSAKKNEKEKPRYDLKRGKICYSSIVIKSILDYKIT